MKFSFTYDDGTYTSASNDADFADQGAAERDAVKALSEWLNERDPGKTELRNALICSDAGGRRLFKVTLDVAIEYFPA